MTSSIPHAPAQPALPTHFNRDGLAAAGFTGWQTWADLRSNDHRQVPHVPAAYVIYRVTDSLPDFLRTNPGGRFKGKDPTVTRGELNSNWVTGAHVVYIGKADLADRRLKQFSRFGAGEPVGHWGGRLIWQLPDSGALRVAWHTITWSEDARAYEKRAPGSLHLTSWWRAPIREPHRVKRSRRLESGGNAATRPDDEDGHRVHSERSLWRSKSSHEAKSDWRRRKALGARFARPVLTPTGVIAISSALVPSRGCRPAGQSRASSDLRSRSAIRGWLGGLSRP